MTEGSLLLIFVGMAAVTYLPRMLPFVIFSDLDFSPFAKKVLKNLRYAILGGLIFPGIFMVSEDPLFGVAGGLVAFTLAYLGADAVFVVIGTIVFMALYTIF